MIALQTKATVLKKIFILIAICTSFFSPEIIQPREAHAAEEVKIGILFDIKNENTRKFIDQLRQEVISLLGSKYDITIPAKNIKTASWDRQSILKEYKGLLADDSVDIIVVVGALNAAVLARLEVFPKPLILLGIMDYELQQVPITRDKKSGIHNLTYILPVHDFKSDLNDFHDIFPYKNLTVVIDKKLAALIPGVGEKFREFVAANDVAAQMLTYDGNTDKVIENIPPETDAVMLGGLYRMSDREKQKLIDHVNYLRLPSYAFQGISCIKLGALAGSASETNLQKITRRIALNIEKIMIGLDPARFSTLLILKKRLTINMETARKINFSPKWSTLAVAELINEDVTGSDRVLDFEKIVQEALSSNLTLSIEEQTVNSAVEDVSKARSDLLPSLNASATATKIDADSAGLQADETTSGALTLTQVVYSDMIWTNLAVKKHLLTSAESKHYEVLLNTVLDAGINYLDILSSKTNQRIRKNYLDLVKQNYEIAQFRERVGYSGAADVYRWKSELATSTSDLLYAKNNVRIAKIRLNEFMLRPLDEEFVVKDIELTERLFQRYGGDEIRRSVDSPKSLELLTDFLVIEAKNNLPEIIQLQEAIAAQKRILRANKRKRFIPVVNFQSQADHFFSREGEDSNLTDDDDTGWSISLNASWPLFEGGGINADVRRALSEKKKLQEQLHDTTRKIELNLRSVILDLRVKSANLRLTKEAAEAADKNFELVQDSYSKGAVSIVSLLDAQNAALAANQSAANSVYEYFISLLEVERSFGGFAVITPIKEQKALFHRFQEFMASKKDGKLTP
ncbi:MAG: TolC family protein [Deltaproteobacteria bacterium]|nr:TolC family protein [Deltaproteobacteria bacterium]